MDSLKFEPKRITYRYRQTINADPQAVFPLLCPVREAEWLDGWRYRMIYSDSGLIETGAVFSTPSDTEADTVWVVTLHDAEQKVLQFARFTPGSRTCVLDIAVKAKDKRCSHVDITYTFTGISTSGNEFIEDFTEAAFLDAVTFWEKSMNHFLETGERLRRD